MICDDEQDLLELYASVIEQKYNVITTVSGFECIKKYCEEKERGSHIDVLLLDYRLKDMLGDEVAQTIRKMNGTKIILISAYDLEENKINNLMENGFIENFLPKPIRVREIVEEIEKIIC